MHESLLRISDDTRAVSTSRIRSASTSRASRPLSILTVPCSVSTGWPRISAAGLPICLLAGAARHIARPCPKTAAERCYFLLNFQSAPQFLPIHLDTLNRPQQKKSELPAARMCGPHAKLRFNAVLALRRRAHRSPRSRHRPDDSSRHRGDTIRRPPDRKRRRCWLTTLPT